MANGYAVSQATRLPDIGFPEFTTKLVTDVFDALVSANIRQTEAYISLIQEVGKTLSVYINDTKDDIDGDEIMRFLATVLPPDDASGDSTEPTKVKVDATLSNDDAETLQKALDINREPDMNNAVATTDVIDDSKYNAILDAVAKRLAANKYDLITEMVKQGILRLVVENGVIETRLTFSTYESIFHQTKAKNYNRKDFNFRAKVGTGAFVSLWFKASASTSYNSISISTAEKVNQDRSGSNVNIFGRVQINFRTDYLPLNE